MGAFKPGIVTAGTYDPTHIILHGYGVQNVIDTVTVLSGQNLTKGRLIGEVTASGKFREALSASSDGSQLYENAAIILEDCDATAGDKPALALVLGAFDSSKVTFGTGMSLAAGKHRLRKGGLLASTSIVGTPA